MDKPTLLAILDRARKFKMVTTSWPTYSRAVVGLAFFEPSTRTTVGFQSAAARLGCSAFVLKEQRFARGTTAAESLEDTVRVISDYCDLLVLRHPEADAIDRAARVSHVPIINGGNGEDEHPSQALIDLFAMRLWHSRLEGLRIGIVGNIRRSRSAHSLLRALTLFKPKEVRLMHPLDRGSGPDLKVDGLPISDFADQLQLSDLDVVYVAGLPQGEGSQEISPSVRAKLRLTQDSIQDLPGHAIILDPLPRIDEIDPSLDDCPNAKYFQQSADGLFVRMALLDFYLRARKVERRA